jgi:hypothetical protein
VEVFNVIVEVLGFNCRVFGCWILNSNESSERFMIFSYQKPKRSVKKPPEFQTQTSFSTAEDELNLKIEDLIDRISRDD